MQLEHLTAFLWERGSLHREQTLSEMVPRWEVEGPWGKSVVEEPRGIQEEMMTSLQKMLRRSGNCY